MLSAHFTRRVLEVKYLHRYHNGMEAGAALMAAFTFTATAGQFMYFTYRLPSGAYESEPYVPLPLILRPVRGLPQQVSWHALIGLYMFIIGELGALYHHILLQRLRADRSGAYSPPRGGLFSLAWCPHYFFEALSWWGIVVASQHIQVRWVRGERGGPTSLS